MSRDYGELEREFIEGLAARYRPRSPAWMALIDGQTFAHRNDMIDWLRQQGLTFAKASRLERIHHNGGKPLYGDKPAPRPRPDQQRRRRASRTAATRTSADRRQPSAPMPRCAPPTCDPLSDARAPARPTSPPSWPAPRATGRSPSCWMRAIREVVPARSSAVHDTHADLAAPAVFGATRRHRQGRAPRRSTSGDHPFEGDLKAPASARYRAHLDPTWWCLPMPAGVDAAPERPDRDRRRQGQQLIGECDGATIVLPDLPGPRAARARRLQS